MIFHPSESGKEKTRIHPSPALGALLFLPFELWGETSCGDFNTHHIHKYPQLMVPLAGFEPATFSVSEKRSHQIEPQGLWYRKRDLNPHRQSYEDCALPN